MTRRTGLVMAALAAFLAVANPATAMTDDERLQFANGLYRRGLFELAVPEYQTILTNAAAAPMHDLAAFRLGESFRSLNRMPEAAAAYEDVMTHHPESMFIHRAAFRRAEIDWQEGRLRDAGRRLQQLIKTKPPEDIEAAALYYLGLSQFDLDRFDDALKSFTRMLKDHPASPYSDFARVKLADLLDMQGKPAAEIVTLLTRVAERPETPAIGAEALAKAGRLAYREREYNEAARLFSALASRYPEDIWNEQIRQEAAWSYLYTDRLEQARVLAVAGLAAAAPEARTVWLYLLANLERRATNVREARARYDDLLASAADDDPLVPAAAFEAANLAFSESDFEEALSLMTRAGDQPGRELAALWIRAGSLRALDDDDGAAVAYQRILTEFPASDRAPAAAYQIALMADERGDVAASAVGFTKVAEQYPESPLAPGAWMAAAAAYQRAGRLPEAIAAWAHVLDGYPAYEGRDEAHIGKARAEVNLERDQDASATLNALIIEHPESRFFAEALFLRGTVLEKDEVYDGAVFHYQRALAASPSGALARQAQNRLVAALQRLGRHDDAAALLNRLLAAGGTQPLPSPLVEWLARWNLEQKDYPAAATAAATLAATGETPAWRQTGFYISGLATLEQGARDTAREAFAAAAALALNTRETALAHYELGSMTLAENNPADAIAHFTAAAERASTDTAMDIRARSYLMLGRAHEALGAWSDAARYYLGVGVLFDDDVLTPESLYRAALALDAQGLIAERDRVHEELHERFPASTWNTLANEAFTPPAATEAIPEEMPPPVEESTEPVIAGEEP